jgi:hypothetical protein
MLVCLWTMSCRKLAAAEKEFETIKELRADALQVGQVEGPPDVDSLIQNADLKNLDCLCETNSALSSLEGRFTVAMWWKIVKRSCQIYGVFERLRSQRSKKRMRDRYAAIVLKQLNGNGLKYAQASNYERLGKFLSEFPAFVFQRQWITVADWFQKVEGKNAVLLDCITSIVPVSSVFLRDAFLLHKHGFQVHAGLMKDHISDTLVELVKTRVLEDGVFIFNNHPDVNSKANDKKRMQLNVDFIKSREMTAFKKALIDHLTVLHPDHNVDSMVGLLSKIECASQLAHIDYTKEFLSDVLSNDHQIPLACLIALTDDTVFDVWPGAIRFDDSRKFKPMKVRLQAGDVLIFRGDLVHAGAGVEKANVRFHAYMDVKGKPRPIFEDGVELTYFMDDKAHILERQN